MSKKKSTIEHQNQPLADDFYREGPVKLGLWTSHIWRSDPKHLAFTLARYKFCMKMLAGKGDVLEVGCGDGFGARMMLQTVKSTHGIDFEPLAIESAQELSEGEGIKNLSFETHDIVKRPLPSSKKYDAAFALDVIEHIPSRSEKKFMDNSCAALKKDGIYIIGTPNITAQNHATAASKEGHINLKSTETLRETLEKYFDNVFMFSMNDEVVHTGFSAMAHYIIGVGVGLSRQVRVKKK